MRRWSERARASISRRTARRPACGRKRGAGHKPIQHDKRRNSIAIMYGWLKDWRRVATRYDCCPKVFLSAVALAATVMFWL